MIEAQYWWRGLGAVWRPGVSARHSMARTRAVAIATFPEGEIAKISGRAATLSHAHRAPLTRRSCVHYTVLLHTRALGESTWNAAAVEIGGGSAFRVVDSTGDAVVHVRGAELSLMTVVDTAASPRAVDRAALAALLQVCGAPFRGWLDDAPTAYWTGRARLELRAVEAIIEPDEQVAVCGRGVRDVVRDPSAVAALRTLPTRLTFRPGGRVPLLISDRPDTLR